MSDYSKKLAEHCENQIYTLVPLDNGPELIMDPHQQEAMELAAIALLTNEKAFSIIHSCGSGKTIIEGNLAVASQRAKEELEKQNTQDVILTTQRALLHSIYEKLDGLGLDVGMWGSGKVQLNRPLILANIQAIQNSIARGDLSKKIKIDETPLLIGDEADLFLTQSRKRAVSQFANAIKVGLTATGTWPDGRDVEDLWGPKIHEMKLKEGILNGVNVPPLYYLFEANLDDSEVQYVDGDYEQKSLQAALKEAEIQKAIPEIYESLVPKNRRKDFPTLVYVPSVNLVHATVKELMDRFSGEDVSIGSWTGERTSTGKLKQDMEAFNKGGLDILVLCEMGSRGIDLPRARFLIDGYPTLSSTKLEQRDGRVLRRIREEGELYQEGFKKAFAMIAQIIPQSNKYRPILLPDILDSWDDFKENRLLGLGNSGGGLHEGNLGSPIQFEVDEIRRNIINNNPQIYVRKVKEIDVLSQLLIRENLPQADEDGFFELEDKRYGTARAWAKLFGIDSMTVKKYLQNENGITGRIFTNNVVQNAFYEESIVRERCKKFLVQMPCADKDGFFELEGEKFGTVMAWERVIELSGSTLYKKLKDEVGITGRLSNGRVMLNAFFNESTVREKCQELLIEMPKADKDGFFEVEGKRYGTVRALAKKLDVADSTIIRVLKDAEGITAKDSIGIVRNNGFYSESLTRGRLELFFKDTPPHADKDGFFELEGKRYGTLKAWGRVLIVSDSTLYNHFKDVEGIIGRTHIGRDLTFYSEQAVKEQCKELLDEMPKANEEGFFEINGERYASKGTWAQTLGIACSSVDRHLKNIDGIKGKNASGRILNKGFYAESVIREKCKDLLIDVPEADENGFFEWEGERYGLVKAWGRVLDVSDSFLYKKLKHERSILGKIPSRGISEGFYAESIVKEKCKKQIATVLKADREGVIKVDGEIYRTNYGWSKVLDISTPTLNKCLKGRLGITGKSKNGRVLKNGFYSESIIRDLIINVPKADEEGIILIDGEIYRTIHGWEKELGVSHPTIKKYLEEVQGVTGKTTIGQVAQNGFYSKSDVMEKLAPYFTKK